MRNRGGGVNFITSNPGVEGMQQVATLENQRMGTDLNQVRLDELMRTRDVEHEIDQAYRDMLGGGGGQPMPGGAPNAQAPANLAAQGMPAQAPAANQNYAPGAVTSAPLPAMGSGPAAMQPQPAVPNSSPAAQAQAPASLGAVPMQPQGQPQSPAKTAAGFDRVALAKRLAMIPGAGAQAMGLMQQEDEQNQAQATADQTRQDHAVTNYFKAIEAGDDYSAHYWGKQAGMDTPPEVMQDMGFRQFMGQAGKWKEFYGSDLQGFHDFYQAALKLHAAGDPQAFSRAYQANPPTVKAPALQGYQQKLALYDELVNKRHWPEADAKAAAFGNSHVAGAAGGASKAVWAQKRQVWLGLHPGDEQGAMDYADGRRGMGDKDATTLAAQIAKDEYYGANGSSRGKPPITERIAELKQFFMTPSATSGGPAGGGEEEDGAIDMRIPGPGDAVHTYENDAGDEIYSNDGKTWYDGDGNLVE